MSDSVDVKNLGAKAQQHLGLYTTNKFANYDPDVNYPVYTTHKCMVRKHLTKDMYKKLYGRVTPNGVTLDKCIQVSVDYLDKCVGLLAGDEESYEVFKELFDAVIDDKHGGFSGDDKHPAPDLDANKLVGGEMDEKYVKSCRVRTGRSVRGFPFPGCIIRAERREVEKIITEALGGLDEGLEGTYYPLSKMTPAEEKQLQDDHFLFQKPVGFLMTYSNSARDWPDGRGIFHNKDKNFLIWINEEDHCRVISMQKGANMTQTFGRFCKGLVKVEKLMKEKNEGHQFMHSDRLGYICACPTNIGTGLRCSVHVQLHNLSKHPLFDDIVVALGLQKRGTGGEHTAAVDDIYDLSNSARLKKTEREFVQLVIDSVNKIIEMEKCLAKGEKIDALLPEGVKAK